SEHLRTGYEKELNDHWNKLEQAHLGLGEALKAEDDEQINLQVTEAGKVIDAMVKGAFKTIKPQLVEKKRPDAKSKPQAKKGAGSKAVQKKAK
ncbi:unnamed protein product, partial [Symbiodinium sp. CCMP2456]